MPAQEPFVIYTSMEAACNQLESSAKKMGVILNAAQLDQFSAYRRELLQWNAKINLVSAKSSEEIAGRHFLDSLTALPFLEKKDARLIDIGSGAGFPGIPLKIVLPSLGLYLVEINRKKVTFLKHIIRLLNLTNSFVLAERTENLLLDEKWQQFFNTLISRAAFKLPEMLPYGAFLLDADGSLIALKGGDIGQELSQANAIASRYNFSELHQYDIHTDDPGVRRKIIVGKKIK